jgi:hypothetical protein
MRGLLRKLWHRIYDDIAVYLATLGGVIASMAWPWVLGMAIDGVLPTLAVTDLVRFLGGAIIAVWLAVKADKVPQEQQKNRDVLLRRVRSAVMRGFAWQAGVAALTAAATGAA